MFVKVNGVVYNSNTIVAVIAGGEDGYYMRYCAGDKYGSESLTREQYMSLT